MVKKTVREKSVKIPETSLTDRKNFNLVTNTLPAELLKKKLPVVLICDELCNFCVTVCPNLACFHFKSNPFKFDLQKIHFKKRYHH